MYSSYFEDFAKLISDLPDAAIFNALEFQYQAAREAIEKESSALADDVYFVLYFIVFVRAAKAGRPVSSIIPLPADHIEFFKETIVRLIQAQELPSSVMKDFDRAFVVG